MKKYGIFLLLVFHSVSAMVTYPVVPGEMPEVGNKASVNADSLWNGKKCAVVLTFDDGAGVLLDNAIPALDSFGFKGTFYISCATTAFLKRQAEWAKASVGGHELGNHTLFHPCDSRPPGRKWVSAEYDLKNYTVRRIMDEIHVNNAFLNVLDGRDKRTFAYTCGDMEAGGINFVPEVMKQFIAARGVKPGMNRIGDVNLSDIDSYMVNGEDGHQLTAWAKQALETGSLLVFTFHGVGGGHSINVSMEAYLQLLHYLKQQEDKIWVATMLEVSEFIVKTRNQESLSVY